MGFKYDEADFLYKKAMNSRSLELISFMVKDIGIDPYECDRVHRASGLKCYNFPNPVDTAISMALNRDKSDADFLFKQENIINFFLENGAMPNRDSLFLDRGNYTEFLAKLPPNLKEHILKYHDASYFFGAPENVAVIKEVIDSFLRGDAELEKTQPITLHPEKEASTSEETKSTTIELTALGIINLHRHISFKKRIESTAFTRSSENDDKIEELHNKIKESRSKISPEEKLSDSAGISPPTSIGSPGPAQQPSPTKRAKT
jgi:hypothetical protein